MGWGGRGQVKGADPALSADKPPSPGCARFCSGKASARPGQDQGGSLGSILRRHAINRLPWSVLMISGFPDRRMAASKASMQGPGPA